MRNPEYSSVDPKTGDVTFKGPLSTEKGDHTHMPARTDAYLPGDERGHVNASSLGGVNTKDNVVPQHADVNHGAYYSMEKGERDALRSGATIDSEKTAFVNGQPGDRPSAFMVNDSVTYPDGHTESVHLSFTNASYAEQDAWNEMSAAMPDTFDAPNPGDGLRDSMDAESYAALMEETDASLPSIADEYAPADYAGAPDATVDSDVSAEADGGVDASGDDGGAGAGDGDGGAGAGDGGGGASSGDD